MGIAGVAGATGPTGAAGPTGSTGPVGTSFGNYASGFNLNTLARNAEEQDIVLFSPLTNGIIYDSVTGTFTINTSGVYAINLSCINLDLGFLAGKYRLLINGTTITETFNLPGSSISIIQSLTIGDTIELQKIPTAAVLTETTISIAINQIDVPGPI